MKKTIARDKRKLKKCKDNGCILLYADEGYDWDELNERINEAIEKTKAQHDI